MNLPNAVDQHQAEGLHAAQSTITEMLRSIDKGAWAEVENPDGWSYHMNIGHLVHQAADEIERLQNSNLPKITDQVVRCSCGWWGIVYDCEPDVDGDGNLGCPECSQVIVE